MATTTVYHPGLTDPTSMLILKDVNRLLKGTNQILCLPFTQDIIYICCAPAGLVTDSPYDNKLLVFHTSDDFVVCALPTETLSGQTNYSNFRSKLLSTISANLADFLKGELLIVITPQAGYPKVELQKGQIRLNIKNSRTVINWVSCEWHERSIVTTHTLSTVWRKAWKRSSLICLE